MASATESTPPAELDRAEPLRRAAFAAKRKWHEEQTARTPREKVETMLRLQHEVLPILRRRRPLAPHERPWPIRP